MLTTNKLHPFYIFVVLLLLFYQTNTACHATCLTCSMDDSATSCTSCDSSLYRDQTVSPGSCDCIVGYIDQSDTSAAPACVSGSCSITCQNLCQGTATTCTSCIGGTYRTLSGTTCPCDTGYYDNGGAACVSCNTKCRSCSTSATTCTDCYSDQHRTLSGSSCNCITGYYDDGTDTCAACSYKCATCSGVSTTCATCAGGATRSTTPTCACVTKYYDDGSSATCPSCHYSCATCSDGLSCATCNTASKFRSYSSATGLCACMNRYYDTGASTELCSSCHATCLTCTGSANTNCLTCNSASHRIFNPTTGKCDCNVGYYQTGTTTELCAACHATCYTCTSSTNTTCSTCNGALFRTFSSNSCPCNAGYYNNVNNVCVSCHSSCATCTSSSTCATCPSATQIVITSTGYCGCATTKYWDSVSSTCVTCNSVCSTCSITGTNCTSCDATTNKRILSGNSCLCKTGYYQNGVTVCATCAYSCLTCDTSGCLTCNATARRTKSGTSCVCSQGYYDNGSAQLCSTCSATCLTCVTSASNCLSCDGSTKFRTINGTTCKCMTGYYDPGTGSSICNKCSNKCASCSAFSTCSTCAGTLSTRGASPSCSCNAKYYDDGVSADCVACQYSCKTCSSGSTCLTCDSTKFRFISSTSGRCACNIRYYDDGTNQLCVSCHQTCLTCSSSANTNCLTCNSTAFRTFNSGTNKCDCLVKYYETSATTQLCSACHVTCNTCSGSTISSCLTCSASEQRLFDGTNKCLCMDTFYLDSSFVCQSCHSSCATCSSSSACLTCPYVTQTINSVTGICQCLNTTVWDSSSTSCIACHFSCKTCSLAATNCTTCDLNTNLRALVGTTCACIDGYYDNSVAVCVGCDYQCLTCDSSGCLTCDANWHRTRSGVTCPCDTGYYDDGTHSICQECQYSCLSCTTSTSCTGCDSFLFRVADATTNLCSCAVKFYEDPASLTCQPCLYHCATCSIGDRCLTCQSATNHRIYNVTTTLCQCAQRFYDDGANQLCLACLSDCLTCPDYSACTTCDLANDHRQLSSATSRCTCVQRYFDDTSTTPAVCTACHYTCVTCTAGTSADCILCNNDALRVKDVSTGQCLCKPGYYDDGTNQLCLVCHYSCQTCSTATTCDSCDSGTLRTLTTLCDCPTLTFYDDGSNKYCLSCHYSCSTCTNTGSCDSCDPTTNFRTPDSSSPYCKCLDGYYDDGYDNQLCVACPYQCKTCDNPSSCLTCNTGVSFRRSPADLCKCIDAYYDDGTNNPVCTPCQYSCKTCVTANQCLTCNQLKFRQPDTTTLYCSCMVGYYDTGASVQQCQLCSYRCLTCSLASTHCLTCNSTDYRTFDPITNTCPCNQYYYDDLINSLCLNCHYSCKTCSDPLTCDSCDPTKNREANPNNDQCKCSIRYYDDGNNNQICNACQSSCLECTNSTQCTACDATALRLINNTANYAGVVSKFCVCVYKHYPQADPQAICLSCHYSCGECSGPALTNCLACSADAHRTFVAATKKCKCMDGYYDNGVIQTCLPCHPWCSKCNDSTTTTCIACSPTYYLKLDVTTCFDVCPDYFFNNNSTMTCDACSSHCITCTSATDCQLCDPGFPLYTNQCQTPCPPQSTFEDTTNNICVDCPTGCLTCNSSILCTSCMVDYYMDNMLNLCFACNKYCKGCTGPGQNQCIDCQYPLYLRNNQCFNISCPYGQYIDSHQGCLQCKSLFSNSLTCNISDATLCQKLYKVQNGLCKYCTTVTGYAITATGDCSQICGDGILIDYQCDDGNNLDGDGCSSNCLAEQGWHCVVDSTGKSVCELDGVVQISLDKIFKYGGQNKIKISMSLSIAIRLNSRFFALTFIGLQRSDSISWQFTQSQTNLKSIEFIIKYSENIENKQIQLSYDTTRRRLLQAITLSFGQIFTISSYPPAVYYSDQQIGVLDDLKTTIYIGCIILLVLSGINFLFVNKMYIHLFVSACIPAQIFILYGLVGEKYTDWIKWSLENLSRLSFVGGFKVGIDSDLPTTQFFNYPSEITKNMGITCCVMLGLWLMYGLISFCKRYLCKLNPNIIKISMYMRYLIITVQFCLLPHMSYSAINALYNSSLTSQTSSINVCLAIFINVYFIGLIFAVFLLSRAVVPNQLMLQLQEITEVSLQENLSVEDNNGVKSGQSKNFYSLQLEKQRDNINSDKQTQKFEFQSSRSELAIMDRPPSKRVPDGSRQKSQKSIQRSEENESDVVKQYDGIGYYYNHIQTYKKIQQGYLSEWLIYDFVELYATGGYRQNLPKKSLQNNLLQTQQVNHHEQSNELTLQKYKNTKFYLPVTLLKIYLFSVVASAVSSQPFILFIILQGISIAYFLYLLLVRPFRFKFSNFRIIVGEFCFICMNGLMVYYMFWAQKGTVYNQIVEKIMIGVIAVTIVLANLLMIIEIVGAWRMEIWNKLQPCLVAMRLRGARKVMDYKKPRPKFKLVEKVPQVKKEEQKQEQLDAFFERMLKKQSLQKQYRRERMIKNPKVVLN